MSQQFRIVNVKKHQFIDPAAFGALPTLLSLASAKLPSTALMVLMANSLGQVKHHGRDDINSTSPVPGSWAGDTIVIAGEYAIPSCNGEEECRLPDASNINLYNRCVPFMDESVSAVPGPAQIKDITPLIMAALMDDSQLETDLRDAVANSWSTNAKEALQWADQIRMEAEELRAGVASLEAPPEEVSAMPEEAASEPAAVPEGSVPRMVKARDLEAMIAVKGLTPPPE
jgi:hypothetical protein